MISLPTAPHLSESVCESKEIKFDFFKTKDFLSNVLTIQEKVDGYGLAFYFSNGKAVVRHKGKQVTYPVYRDGFKSWIRDKESQMANEIGDRLIIFGVWPKKGYYTNMPDLFLIHDIYDNKEKRYWSSLRIEKFCKILGMSSVPRIREGCWHIKDIKEKANQKAKFGKNNISRVYLRYEDDWRVIERAQFYSLQNSA